MAVEPVSPAVEVLPPVLMQSWHSNSDNQTEELSMEGMGMTSHISSEGPPQEITHGEFLLRTENQEPSYTPTWT